MAALGDDFRNSFLCFLHHGRTRRELRTTVPQASSRVSYPKMVSAIGAPGIYCNHDLWSPTRIQTEWRAPRTRRPGRDSGGPRLGTKIYENVPVVVAWQNPTEQAKLVKMVLSNCKIDAVSLTRIYKKPFDVILRGPEMRNGAP